MKPRSAFPYRLVCLLALGGAFLPSVHGKGVGETRLDAIFLPDRERIEVTLDGVLFTSYRYPSDWKFPYLWPLTGPESGQSLAIEKGVRHPHHRSLYFAVDKVNGGNFWQEGMERGRMVSRGPKILETGDRVVLVDECDWLHDGGPSPVVDRRRITITAPNDRERHIRFQIELEFQIETHILPSNHSLFSVEMEPTIAVHGNGTILNAEGCRDEWETFGLKSAWCSYYGELNGVTEGLSILQHPSNPCFPWPFFTRDYGFLSPTPLNWIEAEGLRYQPGDRVSMAFLVVVHTGGPTEAKIAETYDRWSRTELEPVRSAKDDAHSHISEK